MEEPLVPSPVQETGRRAFRLGWLVVVLALIVLVAFSVLVLPFVGPARGLLGKTDLVAYAVCHRIGSHSFEIAGRQLPLCARCTGTFVGAVTGLLGQGVVLRRRRASSFPHPLVLVVLIGFSLTWAADGFNSYVDLMTGGSRHFYEPQNWLRLTTGALNGLTMSALLYPVFHATLWRRPSPERTIRHLGELAVLALVQGALVGLVLTEWPPLLYPLALASALGVLTLLTCVNSMLVMMIFRWENRARTWREALVPLLGGLAVSLIQVGVIDVVRFYFTGTLTGIPPLR